MKAARPGRRRAGGRLFAAGYDTKYLAVVTNRKGELAELVRWHWQKAGTIELVHDVTKNELGAAVPPCGRFGANAAWYRLSLLTYNVLSALKSLALPASLSAARPKRLRFAVFTLAGRIVTHAGRLVRNFVPLAAGAALRRADLRTAMLNEALRRHGVKFAEIEDEVEACVADSRIAVLLGVRPGTPLLAVRRLFLAPGGEPVNLTALLIRSDRYKMTVRLRDHVFE